MTRTVVCALSLIASALVGTSVLVRADQAPGSQASATRDLFLTVGKSLVVDSPTNIQRVSIANPDLAEAVVVNPREVLLNGKADGETSLIIWQAGGNRLLFDLNVRQTNSPIEVVKHQLAQELPGQAVEASMDNKAVFLRGTVNNLTASDRAVAIAGTAGKVVNLLNVKVPKADAQILLKVKFADVDRSASAQWGLNFFSTGLANTPGSVTTGQFSPPLLTPGTAGSATTLTVQNALNIFLLRPDLNFGATIEALQSKSLAQILAEPNIVAINGKPASFLAGGEFPYPTLQGGGGGLGAVTIQFREFGVRINFLPQITPRNTIRLQVTPEVSSLDFANGLVFQGFTIPALSTRRMQTELELETGQSFVIGGLLDNRLQDTVNKIPGLANIPLVGKLFTSKALTKSNTELLVLVTAELVRPIPVDQPRPAVKMPEGFIKEAPQVLYRQPGMDVTGPVPVKPPSETIPVEELQQFQKATPATPAAQQAPQLQFVPMLTPPAAPQTQPYTLPAPAGGK